MSEETNGRNLSIPRGYQPEDSKARKKWVHEFSGIELDDTLTDKEEDLQGIIENHVGFMKIPMAVVGPMILNGQYAKGEFCVPICTLEGTLAMSMNRGIYASALSGGITTKHFRQELSRAPVFIFDNLEESSQFQAWVNDNEDKIMEVAESTTNHGKVLRIDQYIVQNYDKLNETTNKKYNQHSSTPNLYRCISGWDYD